MVVTNFYRGSVDCACTVVLQQGANSGSGEQLVNKRCCEVRSITFAKTLRPSIGKRLQLRRPDDSANYDDRWCHEHREGRDYSRPHSPRDVKHILALY